jgi:hypothetical protein
VISPEGRYCGLTPPQDVPAVGRAHRSQVEARDECGMLIAAFANSSADL